MVVVCYMVVGVGLLNFRVMFLKLILLLGMFLFGRNGFLIEWLVWWM